MARIRTGNNRQRRKREYRNDLLRKADMAVRDLLYDTKQITKAHHIRLGGAPDYDPKNARAVFLRKLIKEGRI